MQENNHFSNNSIKNIFNPTPTSKPKHLFLYSIKKHDRQRNVITIIYLLQKCQKQYQVIQMTMHCSRSPLWWNTVGLCEVQSRI